VSCVLLDHFALIFIFQIKHAYKLSLSSYVVFPVLTRHPPPSTSDTPLPLTPLCRYEGKSVGTGDIEQIMGNLCSRLKCRTPIDLNPVQVTTLVRVGDGTVGVGEVGDW
jgi:hypothetical protein